MVLRGLGALMRAVIVCLMIYYPSLVLSDYANNGMDIFLLFGIIASIVVMIEYASRAPSLIEFSMAPPYNRFRISVLTLVIVFLVTTINPTNSTGPLFDIVKVVSNAAQFVLGDSSIPVRNLMWALGTVSPQQHALISELATGALFVSFISVVIFSIVLWLQKWPLGSDGFNLWPNMPSFHARAGKKTESRMMQIAALSFVLALTFPFVIPHVLGFIRNYIGSDFMAHRLTVFWVITIWAIVPAIAMMRGLALLKVAYLIDHLRKL